MDWISNNLVAGKDYWLDDDYLGIYLGWHNSAIKPKIWLNFYDNFGPYQILFDEVYAKCTVLRGTRRERSSR
jgi:hypothetical protein